MTTVRMNMSAYAIERDDIEVQGCDDAIQCSGWNPTLELACQEKLITPVGRKTEMPAELSSQDIEQFLQRMYRYFRE